MTETTVQETPYHAVRRLHRVLGYDAPAITDALFDEFALSDAAREFLAVWVRDRVGHTLVQLEREAAGRSRTTSDSRSRRAGRRVSQKRSQSRCDSHATGALWFLDLHVPGTIDGLTGQPKLFRQCTAADFEERQRLFRGHAEAADAQARSYGWARGVLLHHKVQTFDDLDS